MPPCGHKSTYSSSSEDYNSLVGGVKYWWVYFGAANLHLLEGSYGAFFTSYRHEGYKGDLHQLGSAQLGSSAALCFQIFGIFGSPAAYKL